MARQEQDREDLLAEATALVERAEVRLPHEPQPVVVGFRRDDSLSVYFGADPVYQFNSHGELRRAYVAGLMYKAVAGKLASLRRVRSESQTQLLRHDLSAEETSQFLEDAGVRCEALRQAFQRGEYELIGRVPADSDVIARTSAWLARLSQTIAVARSPRVC